MPSFVVGNLGTSSTLVTGMVQFGDRLFLCAADHRPVCIMPTHQDGTLKMYMAGIKPPIDKPTVADGAAGSVPAGDVYVRYAYYSSKRHVFSQLSPAKKFDLGRYPKGGSKIVTFDRAGVIQVFCDIHAEMVGFVVAVDSPYYTGIDLAGKYSIPHVPAGEYEVRVWSEGMTQFVSVGEVQVPTSGSTEFTASLVERP